MMGIPVKEICAVIFILVTVGLELRCVINWTFLSLFDPTCIAYKYITSAFRTALEEIRNAITQFF